MLVAAACLQVLEPGWSETRLRQPSKENVWLSRKLPSTAHPMRHFYAAWRQILCPNQLWLIELVEKNRRKTGEAGLTKPRRHICLLVGLVERRNLETTFPVYGIHEIPVREERSSFLLV